MGSKGRGVLRGDARPVAPRRHGTSHVRIYPCGSGSFRQVYASEHAAPRPRRSPTGARGSRTPTATRSRSTTAARRRRDWMGTRPAQQEAASRRAGSEGVREPDGAAVHPPDHAQHHRDLEQTALVEAVGQHRRELRQGEDESRARASRPGSRLRALSARFPDPPSVVDRSTPSPGRSTSRCIIFRTSHAPDPTCVLRGELPCRHRRCPRRCRSWPGRSRGSSRIGGTPARRPAPLWCARPLPVPPCGVADGRRRTRVSRAHRPAPS